MSATGRPRPASAACLDDQARLPADDPRGVLSRRYRALTVGIVSVVLLIPFEATAVSTAMPVAARDLNGLALYGFAF